MKNRSFLSILLALGLLLTALTLPAAAADTGDLTVEGGTIDTDYSWAEATESAPATLTILKDTALTVTGPTGTVDARIKIDENVTGNLTINGLKLSPSKIAAPIELATSSVLNLTILGESNNLKSQSIRYAGIHVPEGATLNVTAASTGKLTVLGAADESAASAGIGGGHQGDCGTIDLNGGHIDASISSVTGDYKPAGMQKASAIGSGSSPDSNSTPVITIGGAWVYAGNSEGPGIDGTVTVRNNGILQATSAPANINASNCIVIIKEQGLNWNNGQVYGNVTLNRTNWRAPDNTDLVIPEGASLTVPAGAYIYSESSWLVNGALDLSAEGASMNNQGSLKGTGSVSGVSNITGNGSNVFIDTGDLVITGGTNGRDYEYSPASGGEPGRLQVKTGTALTVSGKKAGVFERIQIENGIDATITLEGLDIDLTGADFAPIMLENHTTLDLTVVGTSTLRAKAEQSAVYVPTGTVLTVQGAGALVLQSGNSQVTGDLYNQATLTINGQMTVTADGELFNSGTVNGTGSIQNDGSVISTDPGSAVTATVTGNPALPYGYTGGITVTGGTFDYDYSYFDNTLTVLTDEPLTLSGQTTADRIVIATGVQANIFLNDLDIDLSSTGEASTSTAGYCPIILNDGASLTLTLASDQNGLRAGALQPAIYVPAGTTLTVRGTGALGATAGVVANNEAGPAAIGGKAGESFGTVNLESGTLTAIARENAINGGYCIGAGYGYYNFSDPGGSFNMTGGWLMTRGWYTLGGAGSAVTVSGGWIWDQIPASGGIDCKSFSTNGGAPVVSTKTITAEDGLSNLTGLLWLEEEVEPNVTIPVGRIYGDDSFTLPRDFTLDRDLVIEPGQTLIAPKALTLFDGAILYNRGTLELQAELFTVNGALENQGTVTLNCPMKVSASGILYNSGAVNGNGTDTIKNDGLIIQATAAASIGPAITGNPVQPYGATGDLTVTGGDYGTDYTYDPSNNTLIVLTDKPLTVSGGDDEMNPVTEAILVTANDAKLTLSGLFLEAQGGTPCLTVEKAAVLTLAGRNLFRDSVEHTTLLQQQNGLLTLSGSGTLVLHSAGGDPALAADKLRLNGGLLNITGTHTLASCGIRAAELVVYGGALMVQYADIGLELSGRLTLANGAVTVRADSTGLKGDLEVINGFLDLQATTPLEGDQQGSPLDAVVIRGTAGTVYGRAVLTDHDIIRMTEPDTTLTIPDGAALTVPAGTTLYNYGKIAIQAGGTLQVLGTLQNSGNGSIENAGTLVAEQAILDAATGDGLKVLPNTAGDLTVTGGLYGTDYTYDYSNATLTVLTDTPLVISGNASAQILIPEDVNAKLTFRDLTLTHDSLTPVYLKGTGTSLDLTLEGVSTVTAPGGAGACRAINGLGRAQLTVGGTGTLNAIGADSDQSNAIGIGILEGSVTVNGGTVNAPGAGDDYGIWSQNITVNGGTVNAASLGAATADSSNVSITGGVVNVDRPMVTDSDRTGWTGVVLEGDTGTVYGSPTLTQDLEIPAGTTLTVPDGATLTVAPGVTLRNNGTLQNNGAVQNNGTVTGAGTLAGNPIQSSSSSAPVYGGPPMNRNKIGKAAGGYIKTSPIAASEGATITVYVFADEGYELASVTVTDKNGDPVPLSKNAAGRWTYRIPLGGVSLTPAFSQK